MATTMVTYHKIFGIYLPISTSVIVHKPHINVSPENTNSKIDKLFFTINLLLCFINDLSLLNLSFNYNHFHFLKLVI